MRLADRFGYAKFCYNVGKEYGEVFRGSVTGGAVLTAVASYLGLGKVGAIVIGALLVPTFLAIAITAGWCVVRWRVVHATIEREWENNPFQRAQIDTLREIRDLSARMAQAMDPRWKDGAPMGPMDANEVRAFEAGVAAGRAEVPQTTGRWE